MILRDIKYDNPLVGDNSDVLFIHSRCNLFTNRVVDAKKERVRIPFLDSIHYSVEDIAIEFDYTMEEKVLKLINQVEFKEFIKVSRLATHNGKWFCCVYLSTLDKSQIVQLDKYILNPSSLACLVVVIDDYSVAKRYKNKEVVQSSTSVNFIDLVFPNKRDIYSLTKILFLEVGLEIEHNALVLFISKLGNKYDDYSFYIDKFLAYRGSSITVKDIANEMKSTENYIIDDFIIELIKGVKTDKRGNKKIYKILKSLLAEYSTQYILRCIFRQITLLLEVRQYINKGYIPVGYGYSIEGLKDRFKAKSELREVSNYRLHKLVSIASLTTERDLVYIYIQLLPFQKDSYIYKKSTELKYLRILNKIVHRDMFNSEQLVLTFTHTK